MLYCDLNFMSLANFYEKLKELTFTAFGPLNENIETIRLLPPKNISLFWEMISF